MGFSLICWCAELSNAYANYSKFFSFLFFFIKQMVPTVSETFFQFVFFNRLLSLKQLLKNSLLLFPCDNYDFSTNH